MWEIFMKCDVDGESCGQASPAIGVVVPVVELVPQMLNNIHNPSQYMGYTYSEIQCFQDAGRAALLEEALDILHSVYARADQPAFNKWLTEHRAAVDLVLTSMMGYSIVCRSFMRSKKLQLGHGDFLEDVSDFFQEQLLFSVANLAFAVLGVPADRLQRPTRPSRADCLPEHLALIVTGGRL